MANYNKVILVGNLTRDPQLSYLPSQTPVCEFGLAINHRWRGTDGEQREDTCFIDCQCFGKQAETFNQYMAKGRSVLIEGRLQLDRWESQDGQKRSKHRVFVQNFQFLGSGGQGQSAPQQSRPQSRSQPRRQDDFGEENNNLQQDEPMPPQGDDIPF
ncbi:MAG: single-stranded DNA-binding protein [Planctomycetota bacterium]|nr:single-stranded DNA-binding protein [Planctomycetota bacterium]